MCHFCPCHSAAGNSYYFHVSSSVILSFIFCISFIKDPHVSRMSKHVNVQLPTRRSSTSLHVLPPLSHDPPMFPHEPQPQYLHPSHRHHPAPPSHLHQQTLRPSHEQKGNHLTPHALSAFMLRTQMLFSLTARGCHLCFSL